MERGEHHPVLAAGAGLRRLHGVAGRSLSRHPGRRPGSQDCHGRHGRAGPRIHRPMPGGGGGRPRRRSGLPPLPGSHAQQDLHTPGRLYDLLAGHLVPRRDRQVHHQAPGDLDHRVGLEYQHRYRVARRPERGRPGFLHSPLLPQLHGDLGGHGVLLRPLGGTGPAG